jgi:phage/plasmid-associated DNA primase
MRYVVLIIAQNVNKVKDYQFNLFEGFAIKDHVIKDKKKAKAGLKRIKEQMSILCNHDKNGIKVMTYYYAQALRSPHILPNFCLVFISKEGVGKDMFSEFIENVFGDKYCFNTDQLDKLVGRFNSMHGGKIFGVVNETNPVDSVQRRDNIKYIVTAKNFQLEGKHKDPIKVQNYCRITFYANRLTAFPLEGEAR